MRHTRGHTDRWSGMELFLPLRANRVTTPSPALLGAAGSRCPRTRSSEVEARLRALVLSNPDRGQGAGTRETHQKTKEG